MTASQLRSHTVSGSVLPCSPVRLVGPDGIEYVLERHAVTCAETTTDAETKQQKPAAVPVLTLHLRPLTATTCEDRHELLRLGSPGRVRSAATHG